MAAVRDRVDVDPERAWVGGVLAGVAALVVGALAFPGTVYDRFVWKYFWGPVYADAHAARCAWLEDGAPTLGRTAGACGSAPETVAFPGYTVVSEVGYVVLVLVAIGGLALLLRRLQIERHRALFYGLFPMAVFGGALRVVEDANDRAIEGAGAVVSYPLNTLLISPLIYVTVAAVALAALLVSLWLERTGRVDGFEYPLAAAGALAAVAAVGLLAVMAVVTEAVQFYPVVLLVTLAIAGVSVAVIWFGIERFAPRLNAGTGYMGLLVLVGQAVDGAANVVGLELYTTLVPAATRNLSPKHPVNAAVVDVFGTAWPFLALKLGAAVLIVWIFEETVIEESPRFSVMLLVGAVAVGMGPGTRDMLRATFGV
ncbi:hypothetical protein BRD13_02535 [Halobacteriales archaeon SW_5_70_135]|nr:MAG: hypothetical protein BRD13_02535 [Halobacteriales archaeon SW_5_70_135]